MITPEYLKAVRERALKNNPTGKVEPGCTCASCDRLILLDEVERLQQELLEKDDQIKAAEDPLSAMHFVWP